MDETACCWGRRQIWKRTEKMCGKHKYDVYSGTAVWECNVWINLCWRGLSIATGLRHLLTCTAKIYPFTTENRYLQCSTPKYPTWNKNLTKIKIQCKPIALNAKLSNYPTCPFRSPPDYRAGQIQYASIPASHKHQITSACHR